MLWCMHARAPMHHGKSKAKSFLRCPGTREIDAARTGCVCTCHCSRPSATNKGVKKSRWPAAAGRCGHKSAYRLLLLPVLIRPVNALFGWLVLFSHIILAPVISQSLQRALLPLWSHVPVRSVLTSSGLPVSRPSSWLVFFLNKKKAKQKSGWGSEGGHGRGNKGRCHKASDEILPLFLTAEKEEEKSLFSELPPIQNYGTVQSMFFKWSASGLQLLLISSFQ
jgi:hypothetical protein